MTTKVSGAAWVGSAFRDAGAHGLGRVQTYR